MNWIENEHIRGTAKIRLLGHKVEEAPLRWFGDTKSTLVEGWREEKKGEEISGCAERGYAVGWCDGRC